MKHLSSDRIIDIVEGVRTESAEPHLQSCQMCRRELDELRAAMRVAANIDVPEPSPLFWNHLSARVRDAVAAEGAPRAVGAAWWLTLAVGTVAAVLVAIGVSVYRPALPAAGLPEAAVASPDQMQALGATDDAAMSMMADLAAESDWETAREVGLAGLTNNVGGADAALGVLTDGERVELQRLLKEALAKPGA
jgi:hypothetical protein